jgi:formate hydrogenlyase transcriptional activator
MVSERHFRSDLYYRLNVFPVVVPPLRERVGDIPRLVHHFMNAFATRMNKRIERVPSKTLAALSRYQWPGNVRELEHVIERAVILSRGSELEVPLAELQLRTENADASRRLTTLEEREREHIRDVLEETHWLIGGPSGAAALLGIKRTTLQSMMIRFGIERPYRRPRQRLERPTAA